MPTPTGAVPLVSVVVATNRGGPFLAEALGSVAAQSHPRVEVVVVDDGSPDPAALARVVEGFPAVRLVRTAPAGVSAARNRGVAETTGELLAFLDDDDRWCPERLARQVAAMADPDVVLGYCGMRTIDAAGRELVAADQGPVADEADVVRHSGWILLPNLVVRRDAFEKAGGFSTGYRQAEDLDLVLTVAAAGRCAFVADVLVDYRYHASNTTRSHRALAAAIRQVLAAHRADAVRDGRPDLVAAYRERGRANDRFAAWSAARAARTTLRAGRLGAAFGEVAWAVRFAPLAPVWWLTARLGGAR